MDVVTLRRAEWSELEGNWQDLVREGYHPAYPGMGEAYSGIEDSEAKIAQMQHYIEGLPVWAAWAGDRLVGLLCGRQYGERLALYDMYVRPGFQRRGIGRALVETVLRETGAREVGAEVNRENEASQALFSALGFRCARSSDWLIWKQVDNDETQP